MLLGILRQSDVFFKILLPILLGLLSHLHRLGNQQRGVFLEDLVVVDGGELPQQEGPERGHLGLNLHLRLTAMEIF